MAFITREMIGEMAGLTTAKQCLVYLAHRLHRDGETGEHWAGIPTLADIAHCSVSTVKRTNDMLADLGLLHRAIRTGAPNRYELPNPGQPSDPTTQLTAVTHPVRSNEAEVGSSNATSQLTRMSPEQLNSKEQQQQLSDFVAKEFGADAAKKLAPHFDGYTLDDLQALAHRATNEATSNRTGWFVKAVVRHWDTKPRKKPAPGNDGVAGSTGAIERYREQRVSYGGPDAEALEAHVELFQRRMTDNGQSPTETVATEETSGKDGHEP